jgi:uncharacterized damage-inducible protein DinB
MDQKALFLNFWEKEAPATRRVISRIPEGTCDYKPDPKSRTAREIAWLIVVEERILAEGIEKGEVSWEETQPPGTIKEILDAYDAHHDAATSRLKSLDSSQYEKEMAFKVAGNELFRASGFDFAWEFLFDKVHHRGQLSTYLRPMGSTVPSIYGPTADEPF